MLTATLHPPEKSLAQFLLGNLPDIESELVEQHLERCEACTQLSIRLAARDDLTELLKSAALSPQIATEQSQSAAVSTSKWSLETFSTLDSLHVIPSDLPAEHSARRSPVTNLPEELPRGMVNHPRYQVERCIGQGGMGIVWLAQHRLMCRPVVLKSVRTELLSKPQAVERFAREVQAISRLNHPNIVSAYDAELVDGSLYLVTEYVEGETLGEVLKRGPLSIDDACKFTAQAARGLEHAHRAGIIHRDVKPNNIIRSASGQIKVLDFGLAVLAEIDEGPSAANLVIGTPDYISPEQASGAHQVDARADIYSLGCTLYHLLTGRTPFAGTSALVKIDAHRHQTVERPEAIPENLWVVVSRMLAKAPGDRYQSAGEVAELLSDLERLQRQSRTAVRTLGGMWRYVSLAVLLLAVGVCLTSYQALNREYAAAHSQARLLADQIVDRASLRDKIAAWKRNHQRPVSLQPEASETLPLDDTRAYRANLCHYSDVRWDAAIELTAAELEEFLQEARAREQRPLFIQGFGSGFYRRYTTLTVANVNNVNWQFDLNVPSSQWPALLAARHAQGLLARSLNSQMVDGEMLMTVLWIDQSETEVP